MFNEEEENHLADGFSPTRFFQLFPSPSLFEDLPSNTENLPPDVDTPKPSPGLHDLADPNYKYWEAENYDPDPDEPRVRMSSNPNITNRPKSMVAPPELSKRLDFWRLTESTLGFGQLESVAEILESFEDVFAKDEYDLGRFTAWEHTIDTGDHPPITAKPRPLSKDKQDCLAEILQNLERTRLIRPSRSVWASGIVMVRKKDGSWRRCNF